MENKASVPHRIIVVGGKEPVAPQISEAAKAAGIKPQPYYRLQLVPEAAVTVINGKKIITGIGDGRTRSKALFQLNNSAYVDAIREEIRGGKYREFKTTVQTVGGESREETALELTELLISGAWYTEKCPEYYVTDRNGKPVTVISRGTDGNYSKRNAVANSVSFFVFDGQNPQVEYENAVKRTSIGRLLYLADQKKLEAKAAASSVITEAAPSSDDLL